MMGTIAQRLRQEGLKEGRAKGREKGLREGEVRILTRLLELRFGPLPDGIAARIATASTSQLERWSEAALDAPTCEAVFHADRTS